MPSTYTDTSPGRSSDVVRELENISSDVSDIKKTNQENVEKKERALLESPYWQDRVFLSKDTFKDSSEEKSWRTPMTYNRNRQLRF